MNFRDFKYFVTAAPARSADENRTIKAMSGNVTPGAGRPAVKRAHLRLFREGSHLGGLI